MTSLIAKLGGMRFAMLAVSFLTLPCVFFADMELEGLGVVMAGVIPSVATILFFVHLLDALMMRIFMIEQPDDIRLTNQLKMRADLLASLAILVVWGSYFYNYLAQG